MRLLLLALTLTACDPIAATATGDDGGGQATVSDGADGTADGQDGADDGQDGADDGSSDGQDGGGTDDSADPGPVVTADPYSVLGHAQECAVALGRVPGFSCQTDGIDVPITVGGVEPAEADYRDDMRCDKPAMLTGSCLPWSKVGWLPGETWGGAPNPDVNWVFTCRRDSLSPGRDGGVFNDIAMIGHRTSTGETCFFQSFPYSTVERAPSPLERADETPSEHPTADEFWLDPADTARISCGPRCHDNDPWIHSPYIDQVHRADGSGALLVPSLTDLDQPYTVVGTAFSGWELPFQQIRPDGNGCVACHRIGTGGTCSTFARYAGGGDAGFLPLSDHARTFPNSHWMPPTGATSEAEWAAEWEDDIDQLLSCCSNPFAAGCNLSGIPME